MCKTCAHHDIFCAGTSFAREFCRETGGYITEGQKPCNEYKEKTAPAGTDAGKPIGLKNNSYTL